MGARVDKQRVAAASMESIEAYNTCDFPAASKNSWMRCIQRPSHDGDRCLSLLKKTIPPAHAAKCMRRTKTNRSHSMSPQPSPTGLTSPPSSFTSAQVKRTIVSKNPAEMFSPTFPPMGRPLSPGQCQVLKLSLTGTFVTSSGASIRPALEAPLASERQRISSSTATPPVGFQPLKHT